MAPAQNQPATRRIWYVGLKGEQPAGETAFSHLTGISWRSGDVHDIPSAIASQMLAHPDVFSDKSPEEREALAKEARARALQEQAQQASPAGGLAAILGVLPAGTTINLPDGRVLSVSAGSAPAAAGGVAGSLEGAHTSSMAARLAAATGANNEEGAPTTSLTGQVGDATGGAFGGDDTRVQETQVGGGTNVTADSMSLAPGGTVAAAAGQAQDKAAAPAEPAAKAGKRKAA